MSPNKTDNLTLFAMQKETMDELLAHGCLTPEQYNYSLTCLAQKLGVSLPKADDGDKPSD